MCVGWRLRLTRPTTHSGFLPLPVGEGWVSASGRRDRILSGGGFALPDLQLTPVFSLSLWERAGVRASGRRDRILSGDGFALPDLQLAPVFSLSLWERAG